MVERDLPKVDVEGSKPFSRSKINGSLMGVHLFYIVDRSRTREEGSTKFDLCTKCEKANFALDTRAASASPKDLTATLRQQGLLRANTKSDHERSSKERILEFSRSEKPVRVRSQPRSGDWRRINPC